MTKKQAARDQRADRIRRALESLTERELQFFPKTDPMLDQPDESWVKSSEQGARGGNRSGHASQRPDWDSAHSGIL